MLKARLAKEVVLRLPNEIGTLNSIAKSLADKGINIMAVCAWVERDQAVIRLVTDETARTGDTLRARGYDIREADVVATEVPHKPGMLRHITERLADGDIDIHHMYATSGSSQDRCLVVFATANNDGAIVRLNADAVAKHP